MASGLRYFNELRQWSAVDAADLTGVISVASGGTGAAKYNACRIYLNANQTGIANSTHTKVTFDTVDFDPDGIADVITNHRITPNVAGTYLTIAAADLQATTNNIAGLVIGEIRKNGAVPTSSYVLIQQSSTGAEVGVSKSDIFQMNGTTDYLEMWIFVTLSAGTAQATGGKNLTSLSCVRVGP